MNVYAVESTGNYFYPDNSNKQLSTQSASAYYSSHPLKNYKELDNAVINIREKTLYQETYTIVQRKLKKHKHLVWKYNNNKLPSVNPKRQVYFFYTVAKNKNEKYHTRLAIVDVETGDLLLTEEEFDY